MASVECLIPQIHCLIKQRSVKTFKNKLINHRLVSTNPVTFVKSVEEKH